MESASTGLDGARQELDRLDRQGLDNGLDSGSTEPRQLDSSTARAHKSRRASVSRSKTTPLRVEKIKWTGTYVQVVGPQKPSAAKRDQYGIACLDGPSEIRAGSLGT
jgi:hypothetical protein